jgi:diguanylate cyclase (GGDEF)-like protein/PAS domain S-box-containing protein
MRRAFGSLRLRLMLLVLLAVIPALGLLYHAAQSDLQHERQTARDHALSLAQVIAAQQDDAVETLHQVTTGMVAIPQLQLGGPACDAVLARFLAQYSAYATFLVVDRDGNETCNATHTSPPINVADRQYFQAAKANRDFAVGGYTVGRSTGKALIPSAMPILDAGGGFQGALVAGLDLSWLNSALQQVEIGQGATLAVVDANGLVLAATPSNAATIGQPLATTAVVRASAAASRGTVEARSSDGVPRLFGYTPFGPDRLGATLVLGLPTAATYGPADATYGQALLMLVAISLVALAAAWFGSDAFLLGPLRRLRAAAARVTAGDLSARVGSTSRAGELSALAGEFDTMTAALDARTRDLAQREAEAQIREEQLQRILDTMPDALLITDERGRYVRVNAAASELVGVSGERILTSTVEAPIWQRFTLDGRPLPYEAHPFAHVRETGETVRGVEFVVERPDETFVPVAVNASPLRRADGAFAGMVTLVRDVTAYKEMETQLTRQAAYDILTGLPNRRVFLERLATALSDPSEPPAQTAVLFLDLNGFKTINDSLGHAAGDGLLAIVASRLQACIRSQDTVARFGGDEFLVLIERVEQPQHAFEVAERILQRLAAPYAIGDHEVGVSACIGIALGTARADDPAELLRQADTALYEAKAAGQAWVVWYNPELGVKATKRLDLAADLQRAIDQGELLLHYQPEVDLATGTIHGVEALVRWQHPQRGLIPPSEFVPLAEETGLAGRLGEWVLLEACSQAQRWQSLRSDGRPLMVSVNLSAREFADANLVRHVAHVLHETGLSPRCLRLEITESTLMEQTDGTAYTLAALRQLGVQLAIDDFGVGYSSLSYLQQFTADTLKIDQSFVQKLPDDTMATIIRVITSAALSLGMSVIAEGVETAVQAQQITALGCDYGQGYFYSHPLSPEKLQELLSEPQRYLVRGAA